jgi:hypothetical protein
MARRTQWGLALLVVLGFVAPGAAHASAAGAQPAGPSSSPQLSLSVRTHRSDYTPVVVRQGVDLDDARSERSVGGLKRLFIGAAATRRSASPSSAPSHCLARRQHARSSPVSSITLRAPPTASV